MAKPISDGNTWAWADDLLCCWPTCNAPSTEILPLCKNHMIETWSCVTRQVQAIFDHQRAAQSKPRMQGEGWVYFIRFRDRIKIGWTGNLLQRLSGLPHEEVLGFTPGSMAEEKRCHAAFAHLRENGEWFRIEPELLAFIEDVKT